MFCFFSKVAKLMYAIILQRDQSQLGWIPVSLVLGKSRSSCFWLGFLPDDLLLVKVHLFLAFSISCCKGPFLKTTLEITPTWPKKRDFLGGGFIYMKMWNQRVKKKWSYLKEGWSLNRVVIHQWFHCSIVCCYCVKKEKKKKKKGYSCKFVIKFLFFSSLECFNLWAHTGMLILDRSFSSLDPGRISEFRKCQL